MPINLRKKKKKTFLLTLELHFLADTMAAAAPERRARPPPVNEVKTKPEHITSKSGITDHFICTINVELLLWISNKFNNLRILSGTTGSKVLLQANYFKLKSKTDWCLYQYRVDIAPDEDRTIVRKSLLRTHKAALGAYLFDGTVLYTSNRLPNVRIIAYDHTVHKLILFLIQTFCFSLWNWIQSDRKTSKRWILKFV